jgi:hypothetical protein
MLSGRGFGSGVSKSEVSRSPGSLVRSCQEDRFLARDLLPRVARSDANGSISQSPGPFREPRRLGSATERTSIVGLVVKRRGRQAPGAASSA